MPSRQDILLAHLLLLFLVNSTALSSQWRYFIQTVAITKEALIIKGFPASTSQSVD
jgi:hypothetical protein